MLVLLGSWAASAVLRRVYRSGYDEPPEKTPLSWRLPVIGTTVVYIWLLIAG